MTDDALTPMSYEATCARFAFEHEKVRLRAVAENTITLAEFEHDCGLSWDLLRSFMRYMQEHGIVFAMRRP